MCSVYFPFKHETNIACWLFWCLVFLSVFLKICFIVNLYYNLMIVWCQVACQWLAILVKNYFVPMFAICISLLCGKKFGWEKGAVMLQSSILCLAEISESEWDNVIKKHMVCSWFSFLSLSKWFRKFKIYDKHKNISVN